MNIDWVRAAPGTSFKSVRKREPAWAVPGAYRVLGMEPVASLLSGWADIDRAASYEPPCFIGSGEAAMLRLVPPRRPPPRGLYGPPPPA